MHARNENDTEEKRKRKKQATFRMQILFIVK